MNVCATGIFWTGTWPVQPGRFLRHFPGHGRGDFALSPCCQRGPHENRADHGNHRPGRQLPRRSPPRQGLRGLRHGAPLQHRKLRAHRAPRRTRSNCFRATCSTRRRSPTCSTEVQPGRDLQPGRACRFVPTSWQQPVLTAEFTAPRRDAPARSRSARSAQRARFYQASRSEMFGKVRETPQREDDAVLSAQPVRRRQGLRPSHHGQLPRELRHVRLLGHPLQSRSPRRGLEFVTRKITARASPASSCGLRRELRLGNLRPSATGASPATTSGPCG